MVRRAWFGAWFRLSRVGGNVGWVGAATDADILDLAGVTDESVAHFPGGHTSKRLPSRFLEGRNVDAAVLLCAAPTPEGCANWDRAVESRVARQIEEMPLTARARLELHGTEKMYFVFRGR